MRRCVRCTFGGRFHTKGLIGFIQPPHFYSRHQPLSVFFSGFHKKIAEGEGKRNNERNAHTYKQASTCLYRHTQRQTEAILERRSRVSKGEAPF